MEDTIVKIGRRIYNKLYPDNRTRPVTDNYFGMQIASVPEGNELIADKIKSAHPFMLTRLGHTELTCLRNYFEIQELKDTSYLTSLWNRIKGKSNIWDAHISNAMHRYSGFFPSTPENLQRFSELYIGMMKNIDLMAVHWFVYPEDIICRQYCTNASLLKLISIEPYYFENPWSKYLSGKKVLVIHPFEESIKHQFAKRELLFENKDVLPQFELKTIKAVQTIAFNDTVFSDWFEALESMKNQMLQTDFDIALIGAGAYGLPLAAYAKELGKQAIHFGGSLQILFGIKGARWDDMPDVNRFYNEHWIRPLKEETPGEFKKVEDGCYW